MGITFHFLNWLNNTYPKTIWFSGHSHKSWKNSTLKGIHWTNTNYNYIAPESSSDNSVTYNNNSYYYVVNSGRKLYNRKYGSNGNSAWNIHLPSMSRPGGQSGPETCEAAIMRVYSDKVEIEKLGYSTSNNGTSYTEYSDNDLNNDRVLTINTNTGQRIGTDNDHGPEIDSGGSGNYIRFTLTNNSGVDAYFSDKL